MYFSPSEVPLSSWCLTLTQSFLPPKHPIKSYLASREIKPALAEEWHQLRPTPSIPLCFLYISFYYSPFVFYSHSPCHSLKAPTAKLRKKKTSDQALISKDSSAVTAISFSLTPTCPSRQMNVQLQKGASTMWLLCRLDI